jgi:hypothetical protein
VRANAIVTRAGARRRGRAIGRNVAVAEDCRRAGNRAPEAQDTDLQDAGGLRRRVGRYWVVLLKARGLSCPQASRLFTRFLDDFSGKLPKPWRLNAQTASFRRGGGVGFRVKPVR